MPEEQKNSAEAANALIGAVIVAAAVCLPWLLDRTSQLRRFQHINNQSSGGERSGEYEGKSPLQPERDRQDQNRDRASPIKDWQRDNSEKMVRFNKGLLGATVGLVILGGLQFWATYVSQRAFLHLESLSLNTNTLIAGASPTAQAGIKNSGKSTGFVTDGNVSWSYVSRDIPLPEFPQYTLKDVGDSLTGPFVPEETTDRGRY